MLHDWKMVTTLAMLHSNGQLRAERDGNKEKGCQKLADIAPYRNDIISHDVIT